MKKQTKTKRRFTSQQILENVKGFGKWTHDYPKEVTAERLARAVDSDGCTAMHYAAESGYYPPGTKFEHLILAEKYMSIPQEKCTENFLTFYFSSPLEIAICNANFPGGTTKMKLEQAKTKYGTGWDMVKRRLKTKVPESGWYPGAERFRFARKMLLAFPELLTCLNPLKREYDAQMLGGEWFSKMLTNYEGMWTVANCDPVLIVLLQISPGFALKCLKYKQPESEQIRLLKICLLGLLPAVPGVDKHKIRKERLLHSEQFADYVLSFPELASILMPKVKFHAKILEYILASPLLTLEKRKILSQYPRVCAAML